MPLVGNSGHLLCDQRGNKREVVRNNLSSFAKIDWPMLLYPIPPERAGKPGVAQQLNTKNKKTKKTAHVFISCSR